MSGWLWIFFAFLALFGWWTFVLTICDLLSVTSKRYPPLTTDEGSAAGRSPRIPHQPHGRESS